MRFVRFFLLQLSSTFLFAQDYEWINVFEGSAEIRDVEFKDDTVYVLGQFTNTIEIQGEPYTSSGGRDIFLAKLDKQGVADTVYTIGGAGTEYVYDLEIDSSGNFFFGGFYRVSGTFGGVVLTTIGTDPSDRYIAKYTRGGAFVWVLDLAVQDNGRGESVVDIEIDTLGNIFTSGNYLTTNYVNRVDSDGNLIWENYISVVTNDILIRSDSTIDVFGVASNGGSNFQAYDYNGNEVGDRGLQGGAIYDATDHNGVVIMSTRQSSNQVLTEQIGTDGGDFVFSVNEDQTFNWGIRFGNSSNYFKIFVPSITPYPGNRILASGTFSDSFEGGDFTIEPDSTNTFLALISTNGTIEWVTSLGDRFSGVSAPQIDVDSQGHIYLSNSWWSENAHFDCNEEALGTSTKFYVAKIDVLPDAEITKSSQVCEGQVLTFSGVNDINIVNHRWEVGGVLDPDELVSMGDNGSILLTEPGIGAIKLYGEYGSSCGEFLHITTEYVTVLPVVADDLVIEGPSSICLDDDLSFSIDTDIEVSYTWSVPEGLELVAAFEDSIVLRLTDESFTQGIVRVELDNFCGPRIFSKTVSFPGTFSVPESPEVHSLPCNDSTITVSVVPILFADSYEWEVTYVNSGQLVYYESSVNEISFVPQTSTDYSQEVLIRVRPLNDCEAGEYSSELSWTLYNLSPFGNLLIPEVVCLSEVATIMLTEAPEYDSFIWVVANETSVDTLTTESEVLNTTIQVQSEIQVYGVNECGTSELLDTETVIPTEEEIPVVSEECERLLVDNRFDVSWLYKGSTISESSAAQKQGPGTYLLNVNGVCSSFEIEYEVVDEFKDVFIPNVFTPNGDGINDFFVVSDELVGSSMTIFNRAGTPIYESASYDNSWDAQNTISGVYFFHMNAGCREFKGHVAVLK